MATSVKTRAQREALRIINTEKKYNQRLREIFARIIVSLPVTVDPMDYVRTLERLSSNRQFLDECEKAASSMASMISVGEMRTWREAAAASSRGRQIYLALKRETSQDVFISQAIRDIIRENATKIRTVPLDMAKEFTATIQKRHMAGLRPESIVEELQAKAQHLSYEQAKRIARAESGKAATALREARARKYNRMFYYWWSCQDERVRKSHAQMHNVICRWDDPPNPEAMAGEKSYGAYHPRGIFNCRCDALSIVSINDISFPVKCHYHGTIKTIGSLKAFKDFYGLPDDPEE